jgi:uncharacterized protein
MSQPFKLFRLQQVDSLIDQARARVNEIDRIISEDSRLKIAQSRAAQTEEALAQVRKSLRRAEEEVKAQQIKIEQTESTLYGGKVRNPKELQDLQNESAALKRYLNVLEDRQLEEMMLAEEAEEKHEVALRELAEVRETVHGQHTVLITEQQSLTKDLGRMESERQATVSTIEAEDLNLYNLLRKQRKGVAVSKVSENACSACGSTLTPSTVQSAHSPSQITRCTFCGRILYAG